MFQKVCVCVGGGGGGRGGGRNIYFVVKLGLKEINDMNIFRSKDVQSNLVTMSDLISKFPLVIKSLSPCSDVTLQLVIVCDTII